jgi:hypothetical protein
VHLVGFTGDDNRAVVAMTTELHGDDNRAEIAMTIELYW